MPNELELEGESVGIYTKDQIDTFSMGDIEKAKNSYLMSFNSMEIDDAVIELRNLVSLMDTILYKYAGEDKIKSVTIPLNKGNYNFYEIKAILNRKDLTHDKVRIVAELEFKLYNILIKPYHAIPTTTRNSKKKLFERLYSFVRDKDKLFALLLKEYERVNIELNFKDSFANWKCYLMSQMYKHDLDCTDLKVGYGRIGKSIFMLQDLRRIIAYRLEISLPSADDYIEKERIIPDHVIYDKTTNFEDKIGNCYNSFFCFDDAVFIADKRKAMYGDVLEILEKISTFGSRHHIYFLNIQNLSDLDSRATDKANIIDLLTERGLAYNYCSRKNVGIIKDFFGFDIFKQKPFLLRGSPEQVDHNLKRVYSFVKKLKWRDMSLDPISQFYNKLYKIYYTNKELWQTQYNPKKKIALQPTPDINAIIAEGIGQEINKALA